MELEATEETVTESVKIRLGTGLILKNSLVRQSTEVDICLGKLASKIVLDYMLSFSTH